MDDREPGAKDQGPQASANHHQVPLEREMFSTEHLEDPETREVSQFGQRLFEFSPTIFVVPILIAMNVGVFIAMRASGIAVNDPDARSLLPWGASFGPLITQGEWWRLLTATFLHGSLMHIFFNMVLLWQGGQLVERMFGHIGFTVLYLIAALGGSITSVYWHPMAIGVGASGAVFGVFGALAGFALINRHTLPSEVVKGLLTSTLTFIVIQIAYGFLAPRVDVAAHMGGLLTGFAAALALSPSLAGPPVRWAIGRPVAVLALALAVAGVAAMRLPRYDDFPAAIASLADIEKTTAERYQQTAAKVSAKDIDTPTAADTFEGEILSLWTAKRQALTQLRVPPADTLELANTVAYVTAREEAWQLRIKGMRENSMTLIEEANKKDAEALVLERRIAPSTMTRRRAIDSGQLTLIVLDLTGTPVADATATLACPDDRPDPKTVSRRYTETCKQRLRHTSDAEGRVVFAGISGGPYIVSVEGYGYKRDERPVEITGNNAATVRLIPVVDLQAELGTIQELEKKTVTAYDQSVKQLQAQKIKDGQFASAVEALLPAWREARERLATLQVPFAQRPVFDKLINYMLLREQGWELVARGVRKNDQKLVDEASARHKEAAELFKKP